MFQCTRAESGRETSQGKGRFENLHQPPQRLDGLTREGLCVRTLGSRSKFAKRLSDAEGIGRVAKGVSNRNGRVCHGTGDQSPGGDCIPPRKRLGFVGDAQCRLE